MNYSSRNTSKQSGVPKINFKDKTLFGNDAGEDEDEDVLISYFVNQTEFDDFLDPQQKLMSAKGRKGMGKSALLVRFAHKLKEGGEKSIVIQAVPSSLAAIMPPPQTADTVTLENYWKQVICAAVNMELANHLGWAWKDDQIAVVESAEIAGFKGQNIFGALISRLLSKATIGGAIDVGLQPKGAANHEQLLARLKAEENRPRDVWFLLDDIDTKFQNMPQQQAYIACFFSAARYLVKNVKGLGIRSTVRSDVWSSLQNAEDLDKYQQYITDIRWSSAEQKDILANRILAYFKRRYPNSSVAKDWSIEVNGDDLIELAFDRRLRWGTSVAPSIQVLRILAGGRPRWMAQLCRLSGVQATNTEKSRIGIHEINHVMGEFGRSRLADLYKEHSHQFGDLKRLIESFSSGPKHFSTQDLLTQITKKYIGVIGAKAIPLVDGVPYRDSWQLAHFLFKCGFITGHNQGKASLDVPEFISYEDRPDLLEVETNLDDGMTWEIQPAYRKILRTQ